MSKGKVLVTGGCGCLGSYVVKHLLAASEFDAVHVVDLVQDKATMQTDAIYHKGDILSSSTLTSLLADVNPSVIIHTASPPAAGTKKAEQNTFKVNVVGTKNLLECALENRSVRAFVYTSSVGAYQGNTFDFATEDHPLRTPHSRGNSFYSKSKAIADQMVREYNSPSRDFRTACLRMVHLYGAGDRLYLVHTLNKPKTGEQKFQVGKNEYSYDVISASNAARAHLLTANALLARQEGVEGEAFTITDGRPLTFWDLQWLFLKQAGDPTKPDDVWIIPRWAILISARTMEWAYWLFTAGTKHPLGFRVWLVSYACYPKTFSIEKARRVLGYDPVDDRAEVIEEAVAWAYKEKLV